MLRRITLIVAAIALFTPGTRAAQRWNVADVGAVGDGKTDCTATFQRLLDEAGRAGGGVVDVPAGRYRFDGTLSIPTGVTLQGTYRVWPASAAVTAGNLAGTVLLAYAGRNKPDGPPFIRLAGSCATLAGAIVQYPEWRQSDVPPIPYPPCIESHDTENVGVKDCLLLNPYEGIRFVRAHRHIIRDVGGYPIKRGILVDECYDIGHIENIHFWPFGVLYNQDDPYCKWINTHGTAIELGRTDWHYVFNTFCFGYGIGYRFSKSKNGPTNGNFLGLGADCCRRAVYIESTQPPGLLITNGEFVGRWGSEDSVCIEIAPGAEGKVSLVNCSFWGPIDRCVWMRSASCSFSASACQFVDWDNHTQGSPAIQVDAGRALVQGCTFMRENLHVRVGKDAVSAILTGNQAEGGFRVDNRAGARTIASLNERDAIQWSPAARAAFRLTIGAQGDGRYMPRGWHGRENHNGPFRWSTGSSWISVPILPGKRYALRFEADVRDVAAGPDAGLYLGGKRLLTLAVGKRAYTAAVPPQKVDRITLELRCRGWVPRDVEKSSGDTRTLGVQARSLTLRAERVTGRLFDANTGR